MRVVRDRDLQPLNTLAVPARAEYFCAAASADELLEALAFARARDLPLQVLGGGSNVVLAERLAGLTLQICLPGKIVSDETEAAVTLRVAAGEDWHQLVVWCLQRGYYGLENLALIPGTVGAAPVQNIGAYGIEISRYVVQVEALHRADGARVVLSASECAFAYRDSVFKQRYRDQLVITHLILRLPRHSQVEVSYPALRDALQGEPTPARIFDTVCRIRRSKLPDPVETPNCGSFFKNPLVPLTQYEALQRAYPTLPSYPTDRPDLRKLAAAWLIDQAGWKGAERNGAGVHSQQALVLTNPGRKSAGAVLELATDIQQSVRAQFGVTLELEPQLLGFASGRGTHCAS